MKTITQLLCLLAFVCFANTTQAQTKEETITWLKEKLATYVYADSKLYTNLKLESIDECSIVFTYTFHSVDETTTNFKIIAPTAVSGINDKGRLTYNAEVVVDYTVKNDTVWHYSTFLFGIANREENIRERIVKALKHLATFCPKKQEAF